MATRLGLSGYVFMLSGLAAIFAVLAAGLWAGLLWGADGRLPLLISGVVGGLFAIALLIPWVVRRAG